MSATIDIATALVDAGLGTLGVDIVIGPMRDNDVGTAVPDELTAVNLTGGIDPQPYLGGPDAGDIRRARVQVVYRSPRESGDTWADTETRVDAIFDAIHKRSGSDYVAWLADEPVSLGQDRQDRHMYSINVTVITDTRS